MVSREELIEALARVSHDTWRRQANRDKGTPWEKLSEDVHLHDRERAEDTVRELERLGVWEQPSSEAPEVHPLGHSGIDQASKRLRDVVQKESRNLRRH
jgi:hypothetical protein